MEWAITIHDNRIEISTGGIADRDSSIAMAKALTHEIRKRRIKRAVLDHSRLDSVTGSFVDIYERPNILKFIGAIAGIRIAEIVKPGHRGHFRFLETVCVNQGFELRIFSERDPAIQWLLSQREWNHRRKIRP